jgi:hypothetical protein
MNTPSKITSEYIDDFVKNKQEEGGDILPQ